MIQYRHDTQPSHDLCDEIQLQYRIMRQFRQAAQRIDLQIKAVGRHYAASGINAKVAELTEAGLVESLEDLQAKRHTYEKALVKLARQLPVYPWVKAQRGFGDLGLAEIVGEAGDLSRFPAPAKLWQYMGIGMVNPGTITRTYHNTKGQEIEATVTVEKHERQRQAAGDLGIAMAYCPRRRALLWTIGDSAIRAKGQLYTVYKTRRVYEEQKFPAVLNDKGKPTKEGGRPAIWHARAKRYMEKRLLRDLWRVWNGQDLQQAA